jgi:O-methyltransferase
MVDMEVPFLEMYERCKPYTITSIERMYAIFKSTEYICKNNIAGDYVECGVWKGGSSMMAALSLMHFGLDNKELWLYDTFEGMPAASDKDVDCGGIGGDEYEGEMLGTLEEVKKNMELTGYPAIYIKGKIEETMPGNIPFRISLLRLDTDWYESTLHELTYLYPLLISGGVLIIDDYGHWQGAKLAVDSYFESIGVFPFLQRIDYTGRIMIKT